MNKRKIIVNQLIFCKSYQEALSASKAFESFSFMVTFLGERRTVNAKRYLRKSGSKYLPYKVSIQYEVEYKGDFCSYGFVDAKTIKRFLQIVDELNNAPEEERWEIANKYEKLDDNLLYDVYYYENFDTFFKRKLRPLLNRIHLACQIAFSRKIDTSFFEIIFEEHSMWFSKTYAAEKSIERVPLFDSGKLAIVADTFISVRKVWEWAQKHYYNKKDRWMSEARAWVSLSNALNHIGYESLLYSIIGLEYVYTKSEKKVKKQLQEAIPTVIKGVTAEEIKELYRIRSDFVHGSLPFPLYGEKNITLEFFNVNKAAAILLETVRLLVENNANRIIVEDGKINYIKDDTFASRW